MGSVVKMERDVDSVCLLFACPQPTLHFYYFLHKLIIVYNSVIRVLLLFTNINIIYK